MTNELRHGDVYFFKEGSLPLIIEVKSRKTKNPRFKRQKKKLEKLAHYLTYDEVEGFYGKGIKTVRVEYEEKPIYHLEKLSKLIRLTNKNGSASLKVENGLYYIISREEILPHLENIIKCCKKPLVHFLNADKLESKIYPYYPILLSIKDQNALLKYFSGSLFILVIVDISVVLRKFAEKCFECNMLPDDDDYMFSITNEECRSNGMDEAMRVSKGYFGKVIFEFLSLDWMVSHIAQRPKIIFKSKKFNDIITNLSSGHG